MTPCGRFHASTSPGVGYAPVYRFFNTVAGGHFFTTSAAERDQVIASMPQYRFEGTGFVGSDAEAGGAAPV